MSDFSSHSTLGISPTLYSLLSVHSPSWKCLLMFFSPHLDNEFLDMLEGVLFISLFWYLPQSDYKWKIKKKVVTIIDSLLCTEYLICILFHLILTITLRKLVIIYSFYSEYTEIQRDGPPWPRSPGKWVGELGFKSPFVWLQNIRSVRNNHKMKVTLKGCSAFWIVMRWKRMKATDKKVRYVKFLTGHHTAGQGQNFITAYISVSFTQHIPVAVDPQNITRLTYCKT